MNKPKRYDQRDTYLGGAMCEAEDGEYVRWDDVQHLFSANKFIRVSEDRRYLTISRCDWFYPNATENEAGQRDERRRAMVNGRDGDIVLHFADGAWRDAADAALILADADGVDVPLAPNDDMQPRYAENAEFQKWWDAEQVDPQHTMIVKNAAHAAWQERAKRARGVKARDIPDTELPGMWERADFQGGQEEVRGPDWKRPDGVRVPEDGQRWKCSNKDHGAVFTDYHGGRCPDCTRKGLHWSLYPIPAEEKKDA